MSLSQCETPGCGMGFLSPAALAVHMQNAHKPAPAPPTASTTSTTPTKELKKKKKKVKTTSGGAASGGANTSMPSLMPSRKSSAAGTPKKATAKSSGNFANTYDYGAKPTSDAAGKAAAARAHKRRSDDVKPLAGSAEVPLQSNTAATVVVSVADAASSPVLARGGKAGGVQRLRGYNDSGNPEADYDDEFFWSSSDDGAKADNDSPVVFGQFRTNQDLFNRLGSERVYKKRAPFRTANSDDDNDSALTVKGAVDDDDDDDDDNYGDVERVLSRQPVGIAELLRKKAHAKDGDDDAVTSSSISLEGALPDSDAKQSAAASGKAAEAAAKRASHKAAGSDDSSDDALDDPYEKVTSRVNARDWVDSESEHTLADAAKALGVRVVPPHVAVAQLASFKIDYAAVSALDDSRIHAQPLASRVPYDAVSFVDIPVSRFCQGASNVLAGTIVVPPAFVVSHFAGTSAVHVRDLLAAAAQSERWLPAQASPIAQITSIGGLVVALLTDDTLLIYDVHSASVNDEWTVELECASLLRRGAGASAPKAAAPAADAHRCLLVSDACLAIVTGTRFYLWNWRSLLYAGSTVEKVPAPTSSFLLDALDEALLPRAEFCELDSRGHVLLGGATSFAIYDIASEQALFRYQSPADAPATAAFTAIRWSGECVVTLEAAGARVWRVFPLSGVRLLGGGTASESGVAPRSAVVTARSPPTLLTPEDNSSFCAVHTDADWVLLGDSLGRIRPVPLGDMIPPSKGGAGTDTSGTSVGMIRASSATTDSGIHRITSDDVAVDDVDADEHGDDDDDDDADDDADDAADNVALERARGAGSDDNSGDEGRVPLDPVAFEQGHTNADELNQSLLVLLARVQKYGANGLKEVLRDQPSVNVWQLRSHDGQTLLHHVAVHALLDVVREILKKAPSEFLSVKDNNGWTALHTAASFGHTAVVEALLRNVHMSLFESASRDGMTPLHLIARMAWNAATMPQLMALVLKRTSGKVDGRNSALETPLHQACLRGEAEMVRWLLDHGAGINVQKDSGETPLHIAARRGSLPLVRLLIDRGANVHVAASDGRLARDVADGLCAEALSRAMAEVGIGRVSPRRALEDAGSATTLQTSASSMSSSATAASAASASAAAAAAGVAASDEAPEPSLMARLLGRRPEREIGGPAIVILGRKGDEAALRDLLRRSPAAVFSARDKHGQSVLHTAAFGGHTDIVKLLVRHKKCPPSVVQLRDKNGWTPLHSAASTGELAIVSELLDYGGDLYTPTATQRGGTTSAHYLARLPWGAEVEALWRRVFTTRCETDVRDAAGRTPLFDAASKNRAHTIRFLLSQGADCNARAHDGSTPLHMAVASNGMDAVNALIAANVELLDADEIGTARKLAHSLGHEEVADVLDSYHHTLYGVVSPRSKAGGGGSSRRVKSPRSGPSLAIVPHRSVAAVNRAPEYLNVVAKAAAATGTLRSSPPHESAPARVTFLRRDGDRVFCGQENGALTQWLLSKRNAKKPIVSQQCNGPVRSMLAKHGVVLVLAPQQRDESAVVSDVQRFIAATTATPAAAAAAAASVAVQKPSSYELTAVQWGIDVARSTFDSRGRPLTRASALLAECELTLWMRLNVDDKGEPVEADLKALVQPWSERGIIASLLAHRCKLALYVDVGEAQLAAFVKAGKLKLPFEVVTLGQVSTALGRLRRENLPLAPRALRGANDGLSGAGEKDAAMPIFMTLNRGGGFVTLYTLWSTGARVPAPAAVLRAVFSFTAGKRCGVVGPGSGVGKTRGPAVRSLKSASMARAPSSTNKN